MTIYLHWRGEKMLKASTDGREGIKLILAIRNKQDFNSGRNQLLFYTTAIRLLFTL